MILFQPFDDGFIPVWEIDISYTLTKDDVLLSYTSSQSFQYFLDYFLEQRRCIIQSLL